MPINASVISSFEEPEKPERPEQPEKLLYQKKSSHILLNLTALLWKGGRGIARYSGMNEMRDKRCRRLAKAAYPTTLLHRPIPGSQASLPLPEEGALR